jgi:uncharacterized repeat protein (TIGR04138 family)
MQEVSFEEALEIIAIKDPRYSRDAYIFVREALDFTQRALARDKQGAIRHVSGQELLAGIKDYASAQFGPMAMTVLSEWGIHSCQDFGELVFNMVETGGCPMLSSDEITDVESFVSRLREGTDPLSAFLWENLSETARARLLTDPGAPESREILIQQLNGLISSAPLYTEKRFSGVTLSAEAKCLVAHPVQGVALAQLNRLLLELAYPQFRKPFLPPSKQLPPQPAPTPSAR